MRELAILTFQTLDGVMQAPSSPDEDRSGGFDLGGWAADYWEEVMQQVMAVAMAEPYDMLFGRTTYELFASHWPNEGTDNPAAGKLNSAKKYVATSSPDNLPPWQNTTPITGDVVAKVSELKAQDGPLIQVHGSGDLIQTLLANDLIDEFRLWTFPVMLGAGKRLFSGGTAPASLNTVKSGTTPNGVVMGIYRRSA